MRPVCDVRQWHRSGTACSRQPEYGAMAHSTEPTVACVHGPTDPKCRAEDTCSVRCWRSGAYLSTALASNGAVLTTVLTLKPLSWAWLVTNVERFGSGLSNLSARRVSVGSLGWSGPTSARKSTLEIPLHGGGGSAWPRVKHRAAANPPVRQQAAGACS